MATTRCMLWTSHLLLAPQEEIISGAFFFLAIKMFSVLSILQISPSFAKEVVRILNAISLLYSLQAAQGHSYNHTKRAYAIWFLFLLPALSSQSQLPQCRQNRRQLQHCLSGNCRKQSFWRRAWGEQDRGPSVWLCWGNATQPPRRSQVTVDSLAGHVSGSQSIKEALAAEKWAESWPWGLIAWKR